MLDVSEVISIIKNGVSERINSARVYSDLLNMHVTGKGLKEYTEVFNQHESKAQRELRERLMKSNKSIFSFLLRPLDKVFTAKGGSVSYNLQDSEVERLKVFVMNISDGMDIKSYLKKKVKDIYVIDPNGIVMIDVNYDGKINIKTFTTNQLFHYENTGNTINNIIFAPFKSENEDDTKEYYRVVDELTDSIYIKDGDEVYLKEDSTFENFFGYVPAYILGDTYDPNNDLFLSIIDDVLDDANEHLRDVSVNTVHKLSHGYAKYWQYPEACSTCVGDGSIKSIVNGVVEEVLCYTCGGTKTKNRKDASDIMLIDIPQEGEQKIAPEVGGYINPSIEIWKQYKEDILDLKSSMFQSLWGSTYANGTNETATGRLLNVQPQAERVAGVSVTFAKIHEFILSSFGVAVLFKKDYKSTVTYGTRYLMESPDAVLSTYKEAVKENLPAVLQNDLLDRFYQTEYANNILEYQKTKKILAVDPFPTLTAKEVKELGVSDDDLLLKIYYPNWVNQLTDAKKVLMPVEKLKEDLKQFTNNKTIKKDEKNTQ